MVVNTALFCIGNASKKSQLGSSKHGNVWLTLYHTIRTFNEPEKEAF